MSESRELSLSSSAQGNLISDLVEMGLTTYEAKAYLSLARSGELSSTELVKETGIPQPRIYDVMESLNRRGLAWIKPGRPLKYRAVEPRLALGSIAKRISNKANDLVERFEGLYLSRGIRVVPSLWVVRGSANILKAMSNLISKAKREIMLAAPSSVAMELYEQLAKAKKKGTALTLVLYPDGGQVAHRFQNLGNVRVRELAGTRMLLVDMTSGIAASRISLAKKKEPEDDYAVVVEEDEILHMMSYYFHLSLFAPAKESGKRYLPKGPETFTTIWTAIELMNNMQKAGIHPRVRVKGRLLRTGKSVRVTGLVTSMQIEPGYIYSFKLRTKTGKTLMVGGRRAMLEDIEAEEITIQHG